MNFKSVNFASLGKHADLYLSVTFGITDNIITHNNSDFISDNDLTVFLKHFIAFVYSQ